MGQGLGKQTVPVRKKRTETVIINRGDKKAAVVMSLDEYNSLTETNYLFSTEANRKHLLQSIQQANEGKIIRKDLIEE